jgi:xanthine dehydrogenase large subunit
MTDLENIDAYTHVRGESLFIDDLSIKCDTLYGLIFDSPIAHGNIKSLNISKAEALDEIVKIFTYKDIPGENQIGGIVQDEPLLAENKVHYIGQPVALIVSSSELIARKAKRLIEIEIEELPVITEAKEAALKNQLIGKPRTFTLGETTNAFKGCDHVFEGEVFTNGQEHLYLETQGCYAEPLENGTIKITSSTQGPSQVQKAVSKVLGIGMHKIEVDVIRLGGGFGGKEDQATPWAALAALGSFHLKKPIKLVLSRHDDLRMTGKRHPYESNFRIGLSKDLQIKAFEADFYQNAGASADLSPAVAERTLFHATNCYYVKNVSVTVYSCKTNLPPNTAFRGFGGPQGMFVIEAAIAKAALELGVYAKDIQEANLLKENDELCYGQILTNVEAENSWTAAMQHFNYDNLLQFVNKFNAKNIDFKKGLAIMPICFGISFTNTPMNHSRALVHVYQDGSIGISTGAVEMGQGVNTKMLQIAAKTFAVDPKKVKIESTNTTRVANTSPSAASSTADLNGKALLKACSSIIIRLKAVAAAELNVKDENIALKNEWVYVKDKKSHLSWTDLIGKAMLRRVALSENSHYSTPLIYFDKNKEKGHPFAYHVYGTSIITSTVDCTRGTYILDSIKIIHDYGKSMNKGIDIGQVEGALAQGIGWMTMEEIGYDKKGKLLSNALSTYKIPDIFSISENIEIQPLHTEGSENAVLKSKAVGEPPLMYGIGAYFAIQNAIKAFNINYKPIYHSPMTPEKVLMGLYQK